MLRCEIHLLFSKMTSGMDLQKDQVRTAAKSI